MRVAGPAIAAIDRAGQPDAPELLACACLPPVVCGRRNFRIHATIALVLDRDIGTRESIRINEPIVGSVDQWPQ